MREKPTLKNPLVPYMVSIWLFSNCSLVVEVLMT